MEHCLHIASESFSLWIAVTINWLESDGTKRFYSHCDSDTFPLGIVLLKPAQQIHKHVWKLKWSLGATELISKEVAAIKMKIGLLFFGVFPIYEYLSYEDLIWNCKTTALLAKDDCREQIKSLSWCFKQECALI